MHSAPDNIRQVLETIKRCKNSSEPISQDILDIINKQDLGVQLSNFHSAEQSYYNNNIWEERPKVTKVDILLKHKEDNYKSRVANSIFLEKKTERHLLNKLEFNHFAENIEMPQVYNRQCFSRNLRT